MPFAWKSVGLGGLCASILATTVSAWHSPAPPAGTPGSLAGQTVILKGPAGFFVDNADGSFAQKTVLSRIDYYVYKEVGDRLYVRNLTQDGWIKKELAMPPADAVRYFDDIIRRRGKVDPPDPNPFTRRARAREYALDIDAAIEDYDEAIAIAPSFAWFNNRGNLHAKKHNIREAIADYDRAIALNATSSILHTNLGNNLRKIAEFDKAETAYNNAIAADGKHVPAHLGKASLLREKKDYPGALAQYALAAKADERNGQVLVDRGETHVAMGNLEAADADFVKAIGIDPIYLDAHIQRASLKVRQKDYPGAILECDEANMKEGKRAVVWVARARIHFAFDEPIRGLADADEAILRDPRSSAGFNLKGWILATHPDARVRDGKRAVEAAQKACDLTDNKVVRCLDTLAAAHAEAGDFKRAIEAMKKVVADPVVRARDSVKSKARLDLYEKQMPYRESPLDAMLSP